MKLSFQFYALCSLFFVEFLVAADDAECKFWNQLAYNLSHASEQNGGTVRLACNSSCTDIKCSGHFHAPTMIAAGFNVDLCFGLRLNHCDKPVTMDYYLDALNLPDVNISKSGSISHNSSLDLPGPKFQGVDSTIVVVVEMVRVNSTYILFGINANLRVVVFGREIFPVQEKVFPPTYIDIPPCTTMPTKVPFTAPGTCVPLPTTVVPTTVVPTKGKPVANTTKGQLLTNSITNKPTHSFVQTKYWTSDDTAIVQKAGSTPKPDVRSKTYNHSCEIGVTQCEQFEMCRTNTDMNDKKRSGVCVCDPESFFDTKIGFCAPTSLTTRKSPTTKPTGSPSVTMSNTQKSKHGGINTPTTKPTGSPSVTMSNKQKSKHGRINMTAVIIGAVFGGLLLIVVVVSVIIFLGRRRRQHGDYRGRHQLLSDQDDIGDTNVVI